LGAALRDGFELGSELAAFKEGFVLEKWSLGQHREGCSLGAELEQHLSSTKRRRA
jgi:hypothetical protein